MVDKMRAHNYSYAARFKQWVGNQMMRQPHIAFEEAKEGFAMDAVLHHFKVHAGNVLHVIISTYVMHVTSFLLQQVDSP